MTTRRTGAAADAQSPEAVRQRVFTLPRRFRAENANGLVAEWELRIGGRSYVVSVRDHGCTVREGTAFEPDVVIAATPDTWFAMDEGTLTGPEAFLDRRLTLRGNLDLALRLQTMFRPWRRRRRVADLDEVEVLADGIRLTTVVVGRGRPVLLLHGLGATKISWIPLLGPLSETCRLIAPDLPGHGESDKPAVNYSPRFFARVIRHLMDQLEVDRAVVVGNSLGGRIALELALRSPARVSAMALLCPAVPGLRARYLFGFTRVFPAEFGGIPFPLRKQWMERVVRGLFADPRVVGEEAIALASQDFIRIYREPAARVAFFSSLRHIVTERPEPFWATMRRVKQPALVFAGSEDRLVPYRLGAKLAADLPNAELIPLRGVAHVPQFEATSVVLERLRAFLDDVPQRRGAAQPGSASRSASRARSKAR
jgi:pimeloyl-ACP methyl ester carboxylesterase/putative sterol carrier protein